MKQPGRTHGAEPTTWTWLALAWLLVYNATFFACELANSMPTIRRWELWTVLPEVLLANVVPKAGMLSGSWWNLTQRLDLILVAAAIWLSAWSVGSLALRIVDVGLQRNSLDHHAFACGLGAAGLSLLTLLCGVVGWLSFFGLAGLLLVALASEAWLRMRSPERGTGIPSKVSSASRGPADTPFNPWWTWLAWGVAGLFAWTMLLGSLLPPTDFDAKTYHLTGPKEFFLDGKISFLPHNVYTSFPFLTEMLTLLAMVLRNNWFRGALAGQAVLMGFAPLTTLALFCGVRRWFGPTAGGLAAILYLSTPWTYRLAVIPYVEGALSAYLTLTVFAAALAIERMGQAPTDRPIWPRPFLTGLLAGSAMACKYPGLVSVVIPISLVLCVAAWRKNAENSQRKLRQSGLVTAFFITGVFVTVGPWLVKNWLETGNPVFPLASSWWGGRGWDAELAARWQAAHSPSGFSRKSFLQALIDVTVRSSWLSPLLFSFAPLAWLAVRPRSDTGDLPDRRPAILWLWLYAAWMFVTWWLLTHRLDRFWVPMLPIVAALAGVGASWTPARTWAIFRNGLLALMLLFNLGFMTTTYSGMNTYLIDLGEAQRRAALTTQGMDYLNQLLAEGEISPQSRVLVIGETQVFDARMPVAYNTSFNHPVFRDWFFEQSNPQGKLLPTAVIRQRLRDHGITHVYVNWEKLLAHQVAGTYPSGISPSLMSELVQRGMFGDPAKYQQGLGEYEPLSPEAKQELSRWGPSLLDTEGGQPVYIIWQVFRVI